MNKKDQKAWNSLCASFMLPCVEAFYKSDVEALNDAHRDEIQHGDIEPFQVGFYARLSAPGYLDCTDWTGPFETRAVAQDYLLETYGDYDSTDEVKSDSNPQTGVPYGDLEL